MNALIGTHEVFDTALSLVKELSRGLHIGASVSSEGAESQGMLCYGEDMSGGRRFGAGGPRVRRYSWEAPEMVNQEIEWARRLILSPSGMLAVMGYGGGVRGRRLASCDVVRERGVLCGGQLS
ncbi:hypothetical protein MRX96_045831 [Rhipicephalus microplus]